jgi:hypothetical protein
MLRVIPHDGIFYYTKHQLLSYCRRPLAHPLAQLRHFAMEFVAAVEAEVRPSDS